MSDLNGKVVAVTGAARGLGRAMVRGFLAEGAKVVAMDLSRSEERRVGKECRSRWSPYH